MVYSTTNDFFNMSQSVLEDNVAKLINDPIEYMQSATSPIQDSLAASSFYPTQQHQNQRQHQLQYASPMTSMVPHSAPSSPQYSIKTEEPQQHGGDLFLYPAPFDNTQDQHILQSQHSPQQHMMQYSGASFIQQRHQHQQQQQKHHQQLQQQMMYDTTSHSAATSMSIPVTSSILSSMVSTPSSSSLFAPSTIATSAPFFHPSSLPQDDTQKVPTIAFQRHNSYTPAAHPAAPKRKIEERPISPHHSIETASGSNTNNAIISDEPSSHVTYAPSMKSTISTTTSTRLSTSSRLDKVKPTRSTRITKSEMITSNPRPTKKTAKKTNAAESRESSEQPDNGEGGRLSGTGNITHPRRAAQNRAAQRTFRNRRKLYIKELEQKVQEMERTRALMKSIHDENQEVWRRLQTLERLASQSGLQIPNFPSLVPFTASSEFGNGNGSGSMMMMNMGLGSSNDEDEDEEDMSDSFSHHQQLMHQ
ncbi:hypothetical protein BGX27_000842 [Mortierella sp. AM989]|nr:hypothetical protein BGX27_000842 [Mortierella sp. AM989]